MASTSKTLFFEEVATKTLVTTNSVSPFPRRPKNNGSGSAAYRYRFKVGRDRQTEGNYRGDYLAHIPACPYHMPRNANRYNDPRMFLPYKNKGDIIEAADLNKLYDRINLFLYAWNAEINDTYGYGIVNKLRSPLGKNYMTEIVSESGSSVNAKITDAKRIGTNTNRILNKVYFQTYKTETLTELLNKFSVIDNLTINTPNLKDYLSHPIGSPVPYGFPYKEIIAPDGETIILDRYTARANISATLDEEVNSTLTPITFNTGKYHEVYYYNFGRTQLGPVSLEAIANNDNPAGEWYKYNTDPTGTTPKFLHLDYNGTEIELTRDDFNNSEFIFSYRDYTEDPLNPKLYFIGTKIFTRPLEDNFSGISSTNSKLNISLSESDISFVENPRYKVGKYPIIKALDWKNARLTIKTLLDRILSISTVAFSGRIDSETKFEIESYYSQQTGLSDVIDKDNPETVLLNYQAVPGAIIKVEFYNTLIDAYKLMVNSCLCNSDCACNINCVCNTNCGCNYGG